MILIWKAKSIPKYRFRVEHIHKFTGIIMTYDYDLCFVFPFK